MSLGEKLRSLVPGLAVSIAVAIAAALIGFGEERAFGRAWLEPLVLAILLGALVGNILRLDQRFEPGIQFGAKTILELAVALLGLSLDQQALRQLGVPLLAGIPILVGLFLASGYAISRMLGLGRRLAMLVAAGNSICGNSAIAAIAPIIGAKREEVAAAISLTAIVGVVVVLVLPLFGLAVGFDHAAYGAFTGLTVYAVPQVLAAAAPFGRDAIVLATLVKLARVIMLGPLTLVFSLAVRRAARRDAMSAAAKRPALLPWFVIGFAVLAGARALGIVPSSLIAPTANVALVLTLVAMAALGLGVDARALRAVGPRVALATSLSLAAVATLAFGFVTLLGL